ARRPTFYTLNFCATWPINRGKLRLTIIQFTNTDIINGFCILPSSKNLDRSVRSHTAKHLMVSEVDNSPQILSCNDNVTQTSAVHGLPILMRGDESEHSIRGEKLKRSLDKNNIDIKTSAICRFVFPFVIFAFFRCPLC